MTPGEMLPTDERRAAERQISVLINAGLLHSGRDALCRIRNLSTGGIMVETGLPLGVGDRVMLQLRSGRPVRGTVRWAEAGKAGIAFDDPRSAQWVTEKPMDHHLRASPIGYPLFRREAWARVVVSTRQMRAKIVAISPVGVMVENDRDWGTEKVFTISILGLGEHLARLVEGHSAIDPDQGVMSFIFIQPLNYNALNEWLAETPRPEGEDVSWDLGEDGPGDFS